MILKRIKASFEARIGQPYTAKHFEKTKYGRRIKKYKDAYAGKRCFLIGNGPSLRAEDLTMLSEHGEITFAFNRIYNIYDKTDWRPTFYISQDEKMLMGCIDEVKKLCAKEKFIPVELKWYNGAEVSDALYFHIAAPHEDENGKPLEFSGNAAKVIYNAGTGMYTAAQLAAYMGFREIYFIGVDHHFHISQNDKGEIVVDNSVKDYFSDKYNEDRENLYIPNTDRSTLTYVALKEQCEKRNINVLNATRGGKLEVFERVCFDTLFD